MPLARPIRAFAAAALFVAVCGAGSPGGAETSPQAATPPLAPMRFVRVTSDDAACKPDCPEWISAEGKIVTGTADALERVVAALDGRRLPIVINSAGGSVRDAMAMGSLIRAKHLAVVVAHTVIAPCPASATICGEARATAQALGAYCASACTLVLAGGVERYVSPMSFVGVHQMTQVVSKTQVKRSYKVRYFAIAGLKWELSRKLVAVRQSTSTTKRAADERIDDSVAAYFQDMGVREPAMRLTLETPARDVHWLTFDELAASRLASIRLEAASPIVEGGGATGVGGDPIDPQTGAASVFVARSAAAAAGGPAAIETEFAYRRGGGTVVANLLARDRPGAPLVLTLDPSGAQFHAAAAAAGEPARAAIPVRSFCDLAKGARARVGVAGSAEGAAPIDLSSTPGAKPLFDEACAQSDMANQ